MSEANIIGYDLASSNQSDQISFHITLVRGKGNNEKVFAELIRVGLKVEVSEDVMNTIKEHPYIQNNFKLNIKRLNRYRWSIYFDEKL